MIAAAAATTTATKETEAKKGSRNDVKKAENKAENEAAPHPDNFSFNYKITKQASISINNSGPSGAWLIPPHSVAALPPSCMLLNPFGCLPRRGCTLS